MVLGTQSKIFLKKEMINLIPYNLHIDLQFFATHDDAMDVKTYIWTSVVSHFAQATPQAMVQLINDQVTGCAPGCYVTDIKILFYMLHY